MRTVADIYLWKLYSISGDFNFRDFSLEPSYTSKSTTEQAVSRDKN